MRSLMCVAVLGSLALAADEPRKEGPGPKTKLWAGLSVTSPTIGADDVQDAQFFMVSFALANDGDMAVNPEIDSSQFLVNGKELKDWGFIVGNGPRGKDFESLPASQALRFGKGMGRYFTEPGVYKVQWKGKVFESAVVEFRVLAARSSRQRIGAAMDSADNSPAAIERATKRGAATAAADINAGCPVILYFGKPWSVGKPLVDEGTGLPFEIVGGSDVTAVFVAEVEAYNAAIRDWHAKKKPPAPKD